MNQCENCGSSNLYCYPEDQQEKDYTIVTCQDCGHKVRIPNDQGR